VLSGDPRHSAAIRDAILSGLRTGQLGARHGRGHRAGVAIIGGGPGDPGLITVRGRQLLAEADVVLTDRLAPRSLLDELPADVEVIDVSKIPYGRAMAQEQINATLIDRARAGRFVARLKGGDPFVFGRGAEEVLACLRAGVPVTVVPGVSSAVGVPTSAWLPVTHRGVAQEFHVVSVHVPPGDDRSTVDWALLGGSPGTLVLLMAVQRIGAVVAELLRHGRNPDTPVSVITDGTMPTQRTINSTLEQVEGMVTREGIRPPAIVVVGAVVNVAAEITELMSQVTAWL
jgi:uroporphyrin-III C-methyltransferase/precorrin-2 dehydrogenase/sirohydrochlorin ferrochelatase